MKSLRKRLPVLLLLILLPIILFTAFSLYYTGRQAKDRIIENNTSTMNFLASDLDSSLENIHGYLLNMSVFGSGTNGLNTTDDNRRMINSVKVYEQLTQDFDLYNADALFVYAPVYDRLIIDYTSNITYQDVLKLRALLREDYTAYLTNYNWKVGEVAGKSYLYEMNYSSMSGPLVYGAMIDLHGLRREYLSAIPEQQFFVTGPDCAVTVGASALEEMGVRLKKTAAPFYTSGEWIVLNRESRHGYILWDVFAFETWFASGDTFLWTIILLAAFVMVTLFVGSMLIYRWVLTPLKGIQQGIRQLGSGDLDYTMSLPGAPTEYGEVSDAFNDMTAQIRDLKIQVYEEKLRSQESELNFLYMQMRPHFFLNALTTVTNYAKLGQYENMYDFIGYLGRHIRYSLRRHLSDVSVRGELTHIENYVSLQNLQHPDAVMLLVDADEKALRCSVTPFMIYTFVENCIKHALHLDEPLSIFITVSLQQDKLYIAIEDDSTGFPEEYLEKFNDPNWLTAPGEKHIGIRNVKQSLQLLYKDEAYLRLSNAETGGARVEMILPAKYDSSEEEEI